MVIIHDLPSKMVDPYKFCLNDLYESDSTSYTSKSADFFEYLYSFPPKFKIKWDNLDEFTQDFNFEPNKDSLSHQYPFLDFVEEKTLNKGAETIFGLPDSYSIKDFINGYLDRIYSSNFYKEKTKDIQVSLSSIPVFVVLNGHNEIVLSKPTKLLPSFGLKSYFEQVVYKNCGPFDDFTQKNQQLGFFFMNHEDAEAYIYEVANSDVEGVKTLGLSIHCIGLDSAYNVINEQHPNTDFRFIPNYDDVKKFLYTNGNKEEFLIDKQQQQIRFRPRKINFLPFLGKQGNLFSPIYSFTQKNEYFKGVPIYIVQIKKEPRSILLEQYFNLAGILDKILGRMTVMMQGSLTDLSTSEKVTNFVFFDEIAAQNFVKKQGRKIKRYIGSQTTDLEHLVHKPKIFVSNLEDFIECWEENILQNLSEEKSITEIFNADKTIFVPKEISNFNINSFNESKTNLLKKVGHTLGLKYRVLKRYIGIIFSVGYT